jgi:hypothetical protein
LYFRLKLITKILSIEIYDLIRILITFSKFTKINKNKKILFWLEFKLKFNRKSRIRVFIDWKINRRLNKLLKSDKFKRFILSLFRRTIFISLIYLKWFWSFIINWILILLIFFLKNTRVIILLNSNFAFKFILLYFFYHKFS